MPIQCYLTKTIMKPLTSKPKQKGTLLKIIKSSRWNGELFRDVINSCFNMSEYI